jgi:hypothetical protein
MWLGTVNVQPYSFSSSTLPQYPYKENFDNYDQLTYSTKDTNKSIDDIYLMNTEPAKPTSCGLVSKRINGINGLFCSMNNENSDIDTYSDAKGSLSCDGYGYSNSKGGLCMDNKQKELLMTRGGNMTTGNAQIGY